MSNRNIPLEVQEEIMKRFPVKSLIRFRSVSKVWKSLIDNPNFIASYSVLHAHSHHLLVEYSVLDESKEKYEKKYVCIVDDESFPQHKFAPTIPSSVELLKDSMLISSSHGLFCFSGCYHDSVLNNVRKHMAVVWNPSIRKSVDIPLPKVSCGHETVIGFGVCPVTNDPKILMTSKWPSFSPELVKVFTFRLGVWRSPSVNLSYHMLYLRLSHVVVGRFIYWLVSDRYSIDGGEFCSNRHIISFDLTNDAFGEVYLPDNLALNSSVISSFVKIKESLALIEFYRKVNKLYYDVWMMEDKDGIPKSFIKLFTIEQSPSSILRIDNVRGFRRNTDEPVLEVTQDPGKVTRSGALAVFDPLSQNIVSYPEIVESGVSNNVFPYTETLLLLNQPRF